MYKFRVKPGQYANQKEIFFINPKCGHEQKFSYSTPAKCQHVDCNELLPPVEKLHGEYSVAARVKYFAEGKL